MKCIDVLKEEHQKILQVMKKVESHITQGNHDLKLIEDALMIFIMPRRKRSYLNGWL